MAQACNECTKTVKADEGHFECMGFCDPVHPSVVHVRCTKLNTSFQKIVLANNNLFWMCNECAKLMKVARFRGTISALGETFSAVLKHQEGLYAELKDQIAINGKQIAQLSKKIATSATPTQPKNIASRDRPPLKRRRDDTGIEQKQLTGGNRVLEGVSVSTVPLPTEMFWVYLSRLHPSVKPDVVEKITRDGLRCSESVNVVSLVRRDADLNTLNFISYKVGVDPKYRDAALDPNTWPKGILFREFEDYRSKNSWVPTQLRPEIAVTPTTPTLATGPFSSVPASSSRDPARDAN